MKTCTWGFMVGTDEPCGEVCEGRTEFCASHNRQLRKESENEKKSLSKRAQKIEKAKAKNSVPRKTISKNPKDWSNTFLCSDGVRITQAEINENLAYAYLQKYPNDRDYVCEGCLLFYAGHHAHIIPQARCKHLGKTELIWHPDNFFRADFDCNRAIENPKGEEWKRLKNIKKCLAFIKQHDPELFSKFESRLATETKTI